MGMEVLEGLHVSQSQQCPLYRKINKRIIACPVNSLPSPHSPVESRKHAVSYPFHTGIYAC